MSATEYVIVNGEALELMDDGRFPLHFHFAEGTLLFDATCCPPRLVPIEAEGEDKGVTLMRLIPHAPYFAYAVAGPNDQVIARRIIPFQPLHAQGSDPQSLSDNTVTPVSAIATPTTAGGTTDSAAVPTPITTTTPKSVTDDIYNAIPQSCSVFPAARDEFMRHKLDNLVQVATAARPTTNQDGSSGHTYYIDRRHAAGFRNALEHIDQRAIHRYIIVHGLAADTTAEEIGRYFDGAKGQYVYEADVCRYVDPATGNVQCRSTAFVEIRNLKDGTFQLLTDRYLSYNGSYMYVVGSDRKPYTDAPSFEPFPTAVGPAPLRETKEAPQRRMQMGGNNGRNANGPMGHHNSSNPFNNNNLQMMGHGNHHHNPNSEFMGGGNPREDRMFGGNNNRHNGGNDRRFNNNNHMNGGGGDYHNNSGPTARFSNQNNAMNNSGANNNPMNPQRANDFGPRNGGPANRMGGGNSSRYDNGNGYPNNNGYNNNGRFNAHHSQEGGPSPHNTANQPIRDTRESRTEPLPAHLSAALNNNSNANNNNSLSPNNFNNNSKHEQILYCTGHINEEVTDSSVQDGIFMPSKRAHEQLTKYAQLYAAVYLIVIYDRSPMLFGMARLVAGSGSGHAGQLAVDWVAPHRNLKPSDLPQGMLANLGIGDLSTKAWYDGLRVAEGGEGYPTQGNLSACQRLHSYLERETVARPDNGPSTPLNNTNNYPPLSTHNLRAGGAQASTHSAGPRRTPQAL